MQHPTHRIEHTIAFVTPVVEHWLELEEIKDFMAFIYSEDETVDGLLFLSITNKPKKTTTNKLTLPNVDLDVDLR